MGYELFPVSFKEETRLDSGNTQIQGIGICGDRKVIYISDRMNGKHPEDGEICVCTKVRTIREVSEKSPEIISVRVFFKIATLGENVRCTFTQKGFGWESETWWESEKYLLKKDGMEITVSYTVDPRSILRPDSDHRKFSGQVCGLDVSDGRADGENTLHVALTVILGEKLSAIVTPRITRGGTQRERREALTSGF